MFKECLCVCIVEYMAGLCVVTSRSSCLSTVTRTARPGVSTTRVGGDASRLNVKEEQLALCATDGPEERTAMRTCAKELKAFGC